MHSVTEGTTTTSQFLFKTCFKCGQVKLLDDFYKHAAMGDGYLNKCKECTKKDTMDNREANLEYYQRYDRDRGNLPHRVKAREEYSHTEAYRESHRKSSRKMYRENKDQYLDRQRESRVVNRGKHRAREAVAYAILTGMLIKPETCQKCCKVGVVHAHHCDYNKPLEVMWLCPTCHGRWHRENVAIEPLA